MLEHKLKELIVKGSIYCICNNQSQNSAFQPSGTLIFENFSPVPAMVGP